MRQGNRSLLRITRLQTEALMGKPGFSLRELINLTTGDLSICLNHQARLPVMAIDEC